jgi:hypothetical protein
MRFLLCGLTCVSWKLISPTPGLAVPGVFQHLGH